MPTALRILDDGAWISVDDSRRVAVSELWPLAHEAVCDCRPTDFLLEAFYDVGVDGRTVVAGAVGQCIACGRSGSVDALPVGRIVDGEFRPYDAGRIQTAPSAGAAWSDVDRSDAARSDVDRSDANAPRGR